MEQNNKLIAEFMGAEKYHIKSVGDIYYPVPSKNGSEYADKLKYDKSWDWLIPVIAKCTELNNDEFDNQSIAWALLSNSIVDVYDQVVEFIKEQNN